MATADGGAHPPLSDTSQHLHKPTRTTRKQREYARLRLPQKAVGSLANCLGRSPGNELPNSPAPPAEPLGERCPQLPRQAAPTERQQGRPPQRRKPHDSVRAQGSLPLLLEDSN